MPWTHDQTMAGFTEPNQLPWLPIPDEHRAAAADLQRLDSASVFAKTRELIALHRTHVAFHHDRLRVIDGPEELLIFERGDAEAAVLCVFNLSQEDIVFEAPTAWAHGDSLLQGGIITSQAGANKSTYGAWSWRIIASQSAAR